MPAMALTQTARTLYAELLEAARAAALPSSGGSVVRKHNKGHEYLYLQVRDLDGHTRQHYLGPDNEETRQLLSRLYERRRLHEAEEGRLQPLRAAFLAAGGGALPGAPFRVIQAFAHAGVLGPGAAVLIGTHAFHCLGNLLGVRFAQALHTQDIDLASDPTIELAVRPELPAPALLDRLAMGFLPVPALDPRAPSTSYFIRGQELRVDLLTPLRGRATGPRFVPAFQAAATPVRHLEYLLESPVVGLALSPRDLALVQLPAPGRFALHKLMVSTMRPAVFATKAHKDRAQALQVLQALQEVAPDEIRVAWRDLVRRGPGWASKARRAMKLAAPEWVDVVASLTELLPRGATPALKP